MRDTTELTSLEEAIIDILSEEVLSQKQVCNLLYNQYNVNLSERQLRKIYTDIRKKYADELIDFTICHNSKGNFITEDKEVIKKDNASCRTTAYALLKYSYDRDKRLQRIGQVSLEEYAQSIIQEGAQKVADNG